MLKRLPIQVFLALISIAFSCSILQKDDVSKDVKAFLLSFQNNLALPDGELLKQFETDQSKQAIMAAINVLKNQEEFISCTVNYDQAGISQLDEGIRVSIPVSFKSQGLSEEYSDSSSIVMWLKRKGESFVITQLDGDAFYKTFAGLKNQMEWSVSKKKELEDRRNIVAMAQKLQSNGEYDSVIWFTKYNNAVYFYVAKGDWNISKFDGSNNESPANPHQMGLVDAEGKIVIPADYDLIGTIGFTYEDIVEVKKDGKAGLVDLTGKVLVEPAYDVIIPYGENEIFAIVKSDTTYGWINNDYKYTAGLQDADAKAYLNTYAFIPSQFKFSEADQSLCEIPNEEYTGYGVIIPPSYWSNTGLFNPVMTGFVSDGLAMTAFTEYIETENTLIEDVADQVSAMITTIRERYLEGREEFYTRNSLVFINAKRDTLLHTNELYGKAFNIRKVSDHLLEVQSIPEASYEYDYYYEENPKEADYDLPTYTYYEIQDDLSLVALSSNRRFAHTEFVKLDESYLQGEFQHYDPNLKEAQPSTYLSAVTMRYMRDEILASYGYYFEDEEVRAQFSGMGVPAQYDYAQVIERLTDIDKHNLEFLNKQIGDTDQEPV